MSKLAYQFVPSSHHVYVLDSEKESRNNLAFMVSDHEKTTKIEQYNSRIKTAEKWAKNSGTYNEIDVYNIPRSGFKVTSNQRRYSTSNVVWRIEHPIGFMFEISSENFAEIIDNCSIIDKEIIGELFFNTSGYLFNEKFNTYAGMVSVVEQQNAKKKSQSIELNPGDVVESNSICQVTPLHLEYLGRFHILTINDESSTLVHCFIDTKTEKLICYKKLDALSHHKKYDDGKSKKYMLDEALGIVCDLITECKVSSNLISGTYKSNNEILTADSRPFKFEDVKYFFLKKTFKNSYEQFRTVTKDGEIFYSYSDLYKSYYGNQYYSSAIVNIESFRNIKIWQREFPNCHNIQEIDKENFYIAKFFVDKPKKA